MLEEELEEFVRKNIGFAISEGESGKYMHNTVQRPYFQGAEVLMIKENGEDENIMALEAEGSNKPKEIVVLKTQSSLKSLTVFTGMAMSMGDVFSDAEVLKAKR